MQITIREILTIYWPQTVLIIAGLGYLVKRIFDLRTKKIELKQSLFQQNRIAVIMRFMDSYIKLQALYRQIGQPSFNFKDGANRQFNSSVFDCMEELYSSYFYLRLYLDPLEQVRYADLIAEMRSISSKITESYKTPTKDNLLVSEIEVKSFIEEKLRVNNENFKVISELFRENSNKHYPIKF